MPMFYSGQTDYIDKLNALVIDAGVTDLAQGSRTSTTVTITSTTGSDATLDSATTSLAGVLSAADKVKIDSSLTATGADTVVTGYIFKDCATQYYNNGTSNTLNYTNGSIQRWAPNTGAQTLSITNWPPSGNLGEILIKGINLGSSTITWPTINWILTSGSITTSFSTTGVTLQSSGTDFIYLWTDDAGTTIYGKVLR